MGDVSIPPVCVSLQWLGGLRLVRLPAGSLHGLPRWQHGLCMRCVVSCVASRSHGLYSSLELCCEGPLFTSIQEDGCDQGAQQSMLELIRTGLENQQCPKPCQQLIKSEPFVHCSHVPDLTTIHLPVSTPVVI